MNIYDFTLNELENYFLSIGEKKYRASQVFYWLYEKRVNSFSLMTNLSKELITHLSDNFNINYLSIVKEEHDEDVSKFLFMLSDNEHIESVLMRHNYGLSLCISSQVGCNMGCAFCESGRRKKVRNLLPSEMLLQIILIEKKLMIRISHIVVMGIGEPFDNYDNLVKFIENANNHKGLGIGSRHITVSTCGIVPKIYEFSLLPYQVNLAISLHASYDDLRKRLMPINKVYNIDELMDAVKFYIDKTNRRVTFEYILISSVNDSEKDARRLASLVKGMNAYINLIPFNEGSSEFKRPSNEKIMKFYDIIKKENINVTVRREFGSKISAACGQLRSKKEE
ncbi:MAG: 23S rRNA (adenine(2503)-C(2))-methyltransferase RlmN [bacterium]|nr:23S rRNA (adenine(2503)-C(2))-methyltransferase RlmN [bacterium]